MSITIVQFHTFVITHIYPNSRETGFDELYTQTENGLKDENLPKYAASEFSTFC
jgi:hypothetical protein